MDPKTRWEQERQDGKQERTNSILESAQRVFVRKGIEKSTMNDVAKEENLGIATVFRYFPKKEKLVVAVAIKILEQHLPLFQEIAEMDGTCIEKLDKLFDRLADFNGEKRMSDTKMLEAFENYAALSPEPLEDIGQYNDIYHRISGLFGEIVEQGRKDGSIRTDLPYRETLSTLVNAFGIFSKKLSLQSSIVMLETDMDADSQMAILKHVFLEYLRAK